MGAFFAFRSDYHYECGCRVLRHPWVCRKKKLENKPKHHHIAHTMITIAQVLANIRHSVRSFKIEYRKTDGNCSVKSGILGSTKPPSNGTVVLFDGKQPFSVYVDLIVRFDNEIVIH